MVFFSLSFESMTRAALFYWVNGQLCSSCQSTGTTLHGLSATLSVCAVMMEHLSEASLCKVRATPITELWPHNSEVAFWEIWKICNCVFGSATSVCIGVCALLPLTVTPKEPYVIWTQAVSQHSTNENENGALALLWSNQGDFSFISLECI